MKIGEGLVGKVDCQKCIISYNIHGKNHQGIENLQAQATTINLIFHTVLVVINSSSNEFMVTLVLFFHFTEG